MAYRTTRAFREQLHLLGLLSQLESAERAAASAEAERRRWRASRARRRLADLSQALAAAQSRSVLGQVAAVDLLPGIREFLEDGRPAGTIRHTAATHRSLDVGVIAACVVAWLATLGEVAGWGISNRPSLIATELAALVLTPAATLLGLRVPQ